MLRTLGLMAALVAEREGRSPDDFEVRTFVAAASGALMAALVPAVATEGPVGDYVGQMDRAFAFLEAGLRL